MGLRAAENLVAELAAGRVGTDFKLNEAQQLLNIPAFLIYLFGVVIAEDQRITEGKENPHPFSPVRERRFIEFQKQYFAAKDCDEGQAAEFTTFKLTGRILPSTDQQKIIFDDLLKECTKLESESNKAVEALLKEETEQAAAKSKRKNKKKKKKRNELASNGEDEKKTELSEADTVKVLGRVIHNPDVERSKEENPSGETKNNFDGGAETKSLSTPNDEKATLHPVDSTKDEGLKLLQSISCNSTSTDEQSEKIASASMEVSRAEPMGSLLDNFTSSPLLHPDSGDQNNELTQRIIHLEDQLNEANRRSEEDRLANSKALRNQKERYENLIQSLQLRLYISENKVRTYEEALQQHIESISAINRNSISSNYEERVPASPSLISKVLESKRVSRNEEV